MPASKMLAPKTPQTLVSYPVLLRRVRLALAEGRERAADAVEREKVRTCWETGKLIREHILLHQDHADYGKQVLKRLSADIKMSVTEIQYMVEFARAYPIYPTSGILSWGHYRDLLGINDASLRQEVARDAFRNQWTVKETRRQIKKLKSFQKNGVSEIADSVPPLVAKKGVPHAYQIKKVGEDLQIDLGFSNYLALAAADGGKFVEGDIVQSIKSNAGNKKVLPARTTANDIFTYHVRVLDVTDGDTLWVLIDLGFGFTTQQQLRLRGIDASEIDSRDGQAAQKFLARILKKTPDVVIASTKSDKYDRYLADLWSGDRYLNQELLDKGLAVRVTG